MNTFDVIVIGSGAGTKLVRPVAQLGFKVAIIEEDALGGTCLNRGCIPSKMLIHPADIASEIADAKEFEIDIDPIKKIAFEDLVKRVSSTIDSESEGIAPLYERDPNITYIKGHAEFKSNRVIEVNGERISANKVFITTGARPHVPSIKGLEETPFWTYKDALRNTKQPKSLIVVGGGYIATELGYFFGALGTEVQFVVRSNMIKHEDTDIVQAFEKEFSKRFPVHFGETPQEVKYENGEFALTTRAHQNVYHTHRAECLLIATGVRPNTDKLGLEKTDVQLNQHHFIETDDFLETTVPGIYAFGDITGKHMFRHTANYEGDYLFNALFKSQTPYPIKYPPIPHAVFTNPQVASVGKTERELIEEKRPYIVGKNSYKDSAMGMALKSTDDSFVKLLFCKRTKKLLSAHIIGKEASNMIHMLIAYIKMNATLDDMLDTIYVHPALPEIIRNATRKASLEFKTKVKV